MFKTESSYIHSIALKADETLPERFTFPFYYEPHSLCIRASQEIQSYLSSQQDFDHNFGLEVSKPGLKIGKMFGVMIVEKTDGALGYLASFSGKIGEQNYLKGFVPPIFDTLDPGGFYKQGEAELNEINKKIEVLQNRSEYKTAKHSLESVKAQYEQDLFELKALIKSKKSDRARKRSEAIQILSDKAYSELEEGLKKESIYYHFRLRDLKTEGLRKISEAKEHFEALEREINELKEERRKRSAQLQKQIHEQYRFLNYKGQTEDLISVFGATALQKPPAGAGECAAPKLFQFAYEHQLKPIAMAEFWWGVSPRSEVRRHQQFYPSCRSKCEPILGFMMQGLNVDPNPMEQVSNPDAALEIVYEDDYLLVVNKPHEFLSVPGKTISDSVLTRMKAYLPDATGPLLVHRLDMSTSGLLLVAKNEKTHKNLQRQFIERIVKKRYVALLDGKPDQDNGAVELPLRVDLNNRPRQLVCYHYGKEAKTYYKVVAHENDTTRIHFFPFTGRTHQLRVHAAHHRGLNVPIVGDDLYGTRASRLHLHAEQLEFEHPVKKEWMNISCESPF
ncbi:MAG: RNA pseudouridine synthase [Psychroserpens sp.]|nr:RNA pseudouridine synthase [Psychroserpens sp.]